MDENGINDYLQGNTKAIEGDLMEQLLHAIFRETWYQIKSSKYLALLATHETSINDVCNIWIEKILFKIETRISHE